MERLDITILTYIHCSKADIFPWPLQQRITRPRGYKTFFVLNSAEHEILNTHQYKKYQ